MKEPVLIIIKPDGIERGLIGAVLDRMHVAGLRLIGTRIMRATREILDQHYAHITDKPFYPEVVDSWMGKFHKENKVVLFLLEGENANAKARKLAGATNPEEADSGTIRGDYGRITSNGVFENVVHVSESEEECRREMKLWFREGDILKD